MVQLTLVSARSNTEEESDSYKSLLRPLLNGLQWKGDERHIKEVLPSDGVKLTLQSFQDVMVHLGYNSLLRYGQADKLSKKSFPIMWVDAYGSPTIAMNESEVAQLKGNLVTFILFEARNKTDFKFETITISAVMKRFHSLLAQVVLISLLVGVLALAPTIYNMALYDTIIPTSSLKGLGMLFGGVSLALATECVLRHMRNKRLGYFGARIDHFIGCSVFERLLFLPPSYTERASVSAQLNRLRDFESVRDFFTGPLATLFFELPLILIYGITMACIGGSLAFIPVALLGAYVILIGAMNGRIKTASRISANAVSKRQEFLLETLTKLRAIRLSGWEHMWQTRYRQLSMEASMASFNSGMNAQVLEIISYVLMSLGGIATLGFGVVAVIDQTMTVGALIASMMLIWRIVAPMQLCCSSITRIQQLESSAKQVQRLLAMAPEHDPSMPGQSSLKLKGQVTFHRVSLRYAAESEPALLGVSFNIKPGQVIAVKGDNGSGKSSILKLILGLYTPQSGSVRLDGVDVRQFDPVDLRQAIAYVPQDMELLPGSVRDNLLYANPLATEKECYDALRHACALDEVNQLPQKIDTIVAGDQVEGISFILTQRLNLARAYLKTSSIILFDEASHSLGKENDVAFARMINQLRGRCTVILATHREDHMCLADQLLVMNKGELTYAGPPEQVLKTMQGKR